MSTVIIFNPSSGRGQARERLQQLPLDKLGSYELWPTRGPEHAEELALTAAQEGHSTVVAAGGDGTVHEVANGILRAGRPEVAMGIIPIGSANDYFFSVRRESEEFPDAPLTHVDVGQVRNPAGKLRYFVCGLGLGLNGAVTLESRKIHGLQGIPLYGLATLRALRRHYGCPAVTLTFDDRPPVTQPTLMLSVLVGQREGSFLMAPRARLNDGLFDYVQAGQLSRWEVLRLLPRIALFGAPSSYPQVAIGQCQRVCVSTGHSLLVHVDGEFFCQPADRVCALEIDLLPRRLPLRLLPF